MRIHPTASTRAMRKMRMNSILRMELGQVTRRRKGVEQKLAGKRAG
jgi:hypothetical protein